MDETLTNQQQASAQPQEIVLLHEAQAYLVTAGKWARFLSILGFIGSGLVIILALVAVTFKSSASLMQNFGKTTAGVYALSFFYVLFAIFHFFVALHMYQFGTKVKNGIAFQNSAEVTDGLGKLKSFFKLLGIIAIVIMVLYVFLTIGLIVFSTFTAHTATSGY